jgi:putative addiction module antidote
MVIGMATTKITVTLQDEEVDEIRALVAAGEAANVSAFVQHAVRVALHDAAGWRELLEDALRETGGPLTKKEQRWADELLGDPRQIGTSTGIVIPKEMLKRLKVEKGDNLFAIETAEGYLLTPYDPAVEEQLKLGRDFIKEYRETFKVLAK